MRTAWTASLGFLFAGLATLASARAGAGDLLITGTKPDRLFVVDAAKREVRSEWHIPQSGGQIFTIVTSPDGRIAYTLVNRMESISGIDLQTGKEVFRAELSTPGQTRVKNFIALDVTPDGKELIAYLLPNRLMPSEYQVEEPRFAIFRTDAGLDAKPVRTFPAPRRLVMILARPSGKSFYALGVDLYEYDLASGKLLGTRGIQNWQLPQHGPPDVLAFWPVSEPTGVFTTPVYAEKTGEGAGFKTGMMSLDLKTGALDFNDFEDTTALIFSTVLAPDRKTAFGTYTTLTKVDMVNHKLAGRVPQDHTYYAVGIARDGHEVYVGGAMCDIGFYDPATLEKRARLQLPGCGDQSLATLRVIPAR